MMKIALRVLLAISCIGCAQQHVPAAPDPPAQAPAQPTPPTPPRPAAASPEQTADTDPVRPIEPSPTRTEQHQQTPPLFLEPFPGVRVWTQTRLVEIDAIVCLEDGWLEQVACAPNSREHESLVVIQVKPSDIHFSLLLAGFEPGTPGRWWHTSDGQVRMTPPSGDALHITVQHEVDGATSTMPITDWITSDNGDSPQLPWIFSGSLIKPNTPAMGPGEHYVADMTGSIIGLVTFGDEVIGYQEVLSDSVDVQPPIWKVNRDTIPPVGTPVTLLISPLDE